MKNSMIIVSGYLENEKVASLLVSLPQFIFWTKIYHMLVDINICMWLYMCIQLLAFKLFSKDVVGHTQKHL